MTPATDWVFAVFEPMDFVALAVFVMSVIGTTQLVEKCSDRWPSTSVLMARHRAAWMEQLPTRDLKMYDAVLMTSLRGGAAFFASGCMLAIGGLIALLGQSERLVTLAAELALAEEVNKAAWDAKLIVILLFSAQAFFYFVWSHRIFGYCVVLMGTVPDRAEMGDGEPEPEVVASVRQAGQLLVRAGRSFNRGLRMIYFTLSALAWFLGAWALIASTVIIVLSIFRMEFLSATRTLLMEGAAPPPKT
ncbi:MAG: DUF599 domain-containing protein [Pseudomonadota bacterium]